MQPTSVSIARLSFSPTDGCLSKTFFNAQLERDFKWQKITRKKKKQKTKNNWKPKREKWREKVDVASLTRKITSYYVVCLSNISTDSANYSLVSAESVSTSLHKLGKWKNCWKNGLRHHFVVTWFISSCACVVLMTWYHFR